MTDKMQKKFDDFKEKCKMINTEWFERLFDFFKQFDVDENLILSVMDFAFCEEMVSLYRPGDMKYILSKSGKSQTFRDEFFEYLNDMAEKVGHDEFKIFLEKTIKDIQQDYKKYQDEGHKAKTNFVNLFMRRLVIQNPQDVQIKLSGTAVEDINENTAGVLSVFLAGVEIAHIAYEGESYNMPVITFTDFRTLPGLERLGLGTFLFSTFCKEVSEKRPGCSVMAFNVAKGRDGDKVYSSWGAYPIVIKFKTEKDIEIRPMTEEEYIGNGHMFYFSPEIVEKCAKKRVEKYSKINSNQDEDESEQEIS